MLKRIALLSLTAAVFLLSQGHFLVWQGFAWARMLQDFTQRETLSQAVVKTFDGRHPCSICRQIERTRQDRPAEVPVQLLKLDSIASTPAMGFFAPGRADWPPATQRFSRTEPAAPDSPPPRLADRA